MYDKKDIVKKLGEFNYFIDDMTLESFIKNWKIDPIYEDEDGVEFFDNLSIVKIKKGISLKSQGYTNEQIIYHIGKILDEKAPKKEVVAQSVAVKSAPAEGLQNVTVDVTHQTLQMLAEAVADKITADIKEQLKTSDFVQQLLEDGSLKKDNEILAQKIEELTDDNKKLAQRIEELEISKKNSPFNPEFFRRIFH